MSLCSEIPLSGMMTLDLLTLQEYGELCPLRPFLLAGCVMIASGTALFILYRYCRKKRRNLENLIEERTKQLVSEIGTAKHAQEAAEVQRGIARRANELKTELLNIVVHDLKSPLISIKMLSKIIIEEADRSSRIADYASDIFSAAQRMHGLINEILESAIIENGELVLNRKRVDLSLIAELVTMDNRIGAEQKEQQIVFTPGEGCIVFGDEERLRSAVDNLLNNAVKYSALRKGIWITCRVHAGRVRCEIRDEGPGMSEEDQGKAFRKFQRLSAQPTGGEPSTGLGLSIVKQIIGLHGGNVWVESAAGQGSLFIIDLPRVSHE